MGKRAIELAAQIPDTAIVGLCVEVRQVRLVERTLCMEDRRVIFVITPMRDAR